MRIPARSEKEAFGLTIAGTLTIAIAILLGALTRAWVGVAVFGLVLVLATITYLRAPNPDRRTPLRDAALGEHPNGPSPERRRVLVIANDTLTGGELRERIVGEDSEEVEIDVLAPLLLSHVHLGVSDIDREREEAGERLERSLEWAREQGISARGVVGDPSATSAIEDQLRDFGADEVVVVSHPTGPSWQERDALERLRRELEVPVRQVIVGHTEEARRET